MACNDGCVYSRTMNQKYPRECVKCGKPEVAGSDRSKSKVKNFSLIRHNESCINVYDKGCNGCVSTGADFMLTFGSTIDILDGNNEIIECEYPKHVDVFITKDQAIGLLQQLENKLSLETIKIGN